MLAFASVYFSESRLFKGLKPIYIRFFPVFDRRLTGVLCVSSCAGGDGDYGFVAPACYGDNRHLDRLEHKKNICQGRIGFALNRYLPNQLDNIAFWPLVRPGDMGESVSLNFALDIQYGRTY